uniref:Heat shock protein family B (small) member 1 n=1 Tax=Nothobranchius furzeri TaxID=105023 RepID=A0A8C6NU15_NOTFU
MAERNIPFTLARTPSWDPLRDWHHSSRIFDQIFGMPALLEDFPTFPSSRWPGYLRPSILGTDIMMPHSHMYPGQMLAQQARALSRQMGSGVSEIKQTQDSWKVSLDVNHFSPEELVVKMKDGVVEISGKHEERKDEHAFILFFQNLQKVTSSLSPEGILTVEAPLMAIESTETTIPVTVEKKPAVTQK